MSKMKNYVYYEADAFHKGVNPFVPHGGKEDSQPSLYGPGMNERKRVVVDGYKNWGIKVDNASTGFDQNSLDSFYRAMAGDIKKQKSRIGGDWVVAFAVPDEDDRSTIRQVVGEEAIFVLLELDDDILKEHIGQKYKGRGDVAEIQKMVIKMSKLFDSAQETENNTLTYKMQDRCAKENAVAVLELLGNPVDNTDEWSCSGSGDLSAEDGLSREGDVSSSGGGLSGGGGLSEAVMMIVMVVMMG